MCHYLVKRRHRRNTAIADSGTTEADVLTARTDGGDEVTKCNNADATNLATAC